MALHPCLTWTAHAVFTKAPAAAESAAKMRLDDNRFFEISSPQSPVRLSKGFRKVTSQKWTAVAHLSLTTCRSTDPRVPSGSDAI